MKIAAIDIGSNALRLLIKDTDTPNFLETLDVINKGEYYERIPLKSGMDVFGAGMILPKSEITLKAALCRFSSIMRAYGVVAYRACATSAYRDAANGEEVVARANRESGLNVEIISGEEEARITRFSYIPPHCFNGDTFVFADVGGGSTEISVLRDNKLIYSHSFQLGSMRYVCGNSTIEQEALLDTAVRKIACKHERIHCIGVGGCVKFMSQYLNARKGLKSLVAPLVIKVSEMKEVYSVLCTLTPIEISKQYGLPLERADILTPASSIFLRIADSLKTDEIIVPAIGVRNGIIAELYKQYGE